MLGRYVTKYFKQYYEVIELNRDIIDASKITEETLESKLKIWGLKKKDLIINCVGVIKPQIDIQGELKTIQINSVFPRILANVAERNFVNLIHPTTDCIFNGENGNYSEGDACNVNDTYGITKWLGEPENATVIRTSIIGEEVNQGRSLVEFAKQNRGKEIYGFTDHFWNGVTCLQFAKICHEIIISDNFWTGVRHIYSNMVTKLALLEMINEIYNLNLTITPRQSFKFCDRSLRSIYKVSDEFRSPSLYTQINQMKEFSGILYS